MQRIHAVFVQHCVEIKVCCGIQIKNPACVVFYCWSHQIENLRQYLQCIWKAPPTTFRQTTFLNIWFHLEAAGM